MVEIHPGMIVCPAVRVSEEIDRAELAAYLRQHLPARIATFDPRAPIEMMRFPDGRSNLTDLLRIGRLELVLRRPPPGPLAPTAHDMAREFRWLSALHPVFPLAPEPLLLCDDPAVAGSVFYVMEHRHGFVLRDEEPAVWAGRPEARRHAGGALVDTLADLHGIDVTAGLGSLGRPAGFLERQVRGWTERWHDAHTGPLPEIEAVAAWLRAHLPPEPATASIVHGDFKLDNVMLDAANPAMLTAVLDWEMAALGDPLVDLGILLTYWGPTSPPRPGDEAGPVTMRPGWPTRDEILERYAARTGRDLTRIGFYEIFARFKVAVIVQQIFHRYATGRTRDERFAGFDARVQYLAREAAARIR
jgi:aminoglycoside phosphotransferase (APT) family kinase protein